MQLRAISSDGIKEAKTVNNKDSGGPSTNPLARYEGAPMPNTLEEARELWEGIPYGLDFTDNPALVEATKMVFKADNIGCHWTRHDGIE